MEKRLLLAFVVSAVIFAVWSLLFPPAPPVEPLHSPSEPSVAATPSPLQEVGPSPVPTPSVEREVPAAAIAGTGQETVRLANDVVGVEVSSKGGAITSFQLLDFDADDGKVLDLVQRVPLAAASDPLQLVVDGEPDQRPYAMEQQGNTVTLRWADGRGDAVEKTIELPAQGYGLKVRVVSSGSLASAAVSVGTGLRNLSLAERNSRLARWGDIALLADGKYEEVRRTKVKESRTIEPSSVAYVGFQDAYFLDLLRPATPIRKIEIVPLEYQESQQTDAKAKPLAVLELLAYPRDGELDGELLGAPKEYNLLHSIGGGVERTLDFGIFSPISVLFLKALRWIYGWVGNYGIAIILLTFAIRIVLFPLMHTSTVSMRKMQKLQPKIKEIQGRYKKKKGDPQARAKMNQETMALYKQEGVNPMGGCLPMLVQLPILWALYKLFLHAIALRHAPFILWIHDLSVKDPYYITPILMTASMWLQQRLAPQAGDPQQQKIMRVLPLVFGIMFLQFPAGLVLYWLTNNVLTIIQQEFTLHLLGERGWGRRLGFGRKG